MKIPSKRLFRSHYQISNLEYKHYSEEFREILVSDLFANTSKLMNKELRDKVLIDEDSEMSKFSDKTTFFFGAYVIPIDEIEDLSKKLLGTWIIQKLELYIIIKINRIYLNNI